MYHMASSETHLSHIHLNKTRISASILLNWGSDKEYYIQQYGYNTSFSVKHKETIHFRPYLKEYSLPKSSRRKSEMIFSVLIEKKEYNKGKWE